MIAEILRRSPGTDPLVEIGRLLGVINKAYLRHDEENNEKACDALEDLRDALERMARAERAASLEGAMVQVILASGEANSIEAGCDDAVIVEYAHRIQRLLYSIVAILAEKTGVDPEVFARDYYMPADFDPYKIAETALSEAA
jgi:hypothetical protein